MTTTLRKSSRARKQTQFFVPKTQHSASSEDEEDEAYEEQHTTRRKPTSKRVMPPPPPQTSSSRRGVSHTGRRAQSQASRRPPPVSTSQRVGELFSVLKDKNTALIEVVRDWFDKHADESDEPSVTQLINLLCQCGLYSGDAFDEAETSWDDLAEDTFEERVDRVCEQIAESLDGSLADSYPLNMNTAAWKPFQKNFLQLWRFFLLEGKTEFLLRDRRSRVLVQFIIAASKARLKSLRHTATVAGMQIGSVLIDLINEISGSLQKSKRQFLAEEKKCLAKLSESDKKEYRYYEQKLGHLSSSSSSMSQSSRSSSSMSQSSRSSSLSSSASQSSQSSRLSDASDSQDSVASTETLRNRMQSFLSTKATRIHETCSEMVQNISKLEEIMMRLVHGVFAHRYRDVEPTIRALALEQYGRWIAAYPRFFLQDRFTKYLGWMLNDTNVSVRTCALDALDQLFAEDGNIPRLTNFVDRFKERIIEMLHDPKCAVVERVLNLLQSMLPHEFLYKEDVFMAEECLFIDDNAFTAAQRSKGCDGNWENARVAAARFIMVSDDDLNDAHLNGMDDDDDDDLSMDGAAKPLSDAVKLLGFSRMIVRHVHGDDADDDVDEGDEETSGARKNAQRLSNTTDRVARNQDILALQATDAAVRVFRAVEGSEFLFNWEAACEVLLNEGKSDPMFVERLGGNSGLSVTEARIIVQIVKSCAEMVMFHAPNSRMKKADKEAFVQRKSRFSKDIIQALPQLLVKYKSDDLILERLASLVQWLDMDAFTAKTHQKPVEKLTSQLVDMLNNHNNTNVVVSLGSALNRMCEHAHIAQRFTQRSVKDAYAQLVTKNLDIIRADTEWLASSSKTSTSSSSARPSSADRQTVADQEYNLLLNLRRLSVLERALSSLELFRDGQQNDIPLELVLKDLRERCCDEHLTKRVQLVDKTTAGKERRKSVSSAIALKFEVLNPRVFSELLTLCMVRFLQAFHESAKHGSADMDVDEDHETNRWRTTAASWRDIIVEIVEKVATLHVHGGEGTANLDDEEVKSLNAYVDKLKDHVIPVYHDMRLISSCRLAQENSCLGDLAWTPSRAVQQFVARHLQREFVNLNERVGDIEATLKKTNHEDADDDDDSSETAAEEAELIHDVVAFQMENRFAGMQILPFVRTTLFSDAGDDMTLKTAATLLQHSIEQFGEPVSEAIKKFHTELKNKNPKRCMELHLMTLTLGYVNARKNEAKDEGLRWENTQTLSEHLAKSLGVAGGQKHVERLVAAVSTMVLKGVRRAFEDSPRDFRFLDLLVGYLKYGGFVRGKYKAGLVAEWNKLLEQLPEELQDEIEEARTQQDPDEMDMEIAALLDFEATLTKGVRGVPSSASATSRRGAATRKSIGNLEKIDEEEGSVEDAEKGTVEEEGKGDEEDTEGRKTATSPATNAKVRDDTDQLDDSDEATTDPHGSSPSDTTPSAKKKPRLDKHDDDPTNATNNDTETEEEEARFREKAQKSVFESDSDDVQTANNSSTSQATDDGEDALFESGEENRSKRKSTGAASTTPTKQRKTQPNDDEDNAEIAVLGARRRRRSSRRG